MDCNILCIFIVSQFRTEKMEKNQKEFELESAYQMRYGFELIHFVKI